MQIRIFNLRSLNAFVLTLLMLTSSVTHAQVAASLPDFRELVRGNQASVVNISTTQKQAPRASMPPGWERFERGMPGMPQEREGHSLGSGFIISADGKILTNAHVVDGAESITVKLSDRTEKTAKVLGIDKASDVALLKIDAKNLPIAKIGDSDKLTVGEWVLAIGSPFGLEYTATHGIVSATGRSVGGSNYVPFIQTDVPVNPGNSGGPLFNLRGEVVGINSQIYSRTGGYMGLSFAIPINIARNVATQLEQFGHVNRGWLGVSVQSVSSDMSKALGLDKPAGALVGDVDANGPAAKAGIKTGDIILEFDGRVLADSADLPPLVGATPVGRSVPMKLWRDQRIVTVNTTVAALKNEKGAASDTDSNANADKAILNMAIVPVPAEAREQLDLKSGGVMVAEVRSGPAARAGIERGDIILKLNGTDVQNPEQFTKLVPELPRGEPIAVLVQKGEGGKIFVTITVPEKQS
jgi:serine protease Do